MSGFVDEAFGYPAAFFTAAVIVVTGFWLLVLCGATRQNAFDPDVDADALGIGGVPVAVSATLLISVGWCVSLGGSVLLERAGTEGLTHAVLDLAVLLLSALLGWCATRALVPSLRRWFPATASGAGFAGPSGDFGGHRRDLS